MIKADTSTCSMLQQSYICSLQYLCCLQREAWRKHSDLGCSYSTRTGIVAWADLLYDHDGPPDKVWKAHNVISIMNASF